MSRADRDLAAASLMADALFTAPPVDGPWLVVDDPTAAVTTVLEQRGQPFARWDRFAGGLSSDPSPEPPAGPFGAVAMRMNRAREVLEYALHAAAARVAPGAPLYLYGANDEGARSAGKRLAPLFAEAETVETRRHCRLWRAIRTEEPARGALADHRREVTLPLPGGAVTLVSYPGVFAKGRLDDGSRLLLTALADAPLGTVRRALDFGCGLGVLALGVRQRFAEVTLHALDADAVAVAAARENLPGASVAVGDRWGALAWLDTRAGGYDLIVSNPPLHRGVTLELGLLSDFVEGAARELTPGGALILVTQQHRAAHRVVEEHLGTPQLLAEDGRFRVWLARK
ncbi:MAG: class I SAM-dependent methyltransferase [Alphaproteobacteria bacterium]|nr:class I SAM-dependent methyltransferase [Alphaproteobacteria bacterium]